MQARPKKKISELAQRTEGWNCSLLKAGVKKRLAILSRLPNM
jgi:hypothetical protein